MLRNIATQGTPEKRLHDTGVVLFNLFTVEDLGQLVLKVADLW